MDTPLDTLPKPVQETITRLSDGSVITLEEAISQWDTEQALMLDFQEKFNNEHQVSNNLIKLAWLARRAVHAMHKDAGLFITPQTRNKADDFLEELERLSKAIGSLREKLEEQP